jgi:hypothetical protein
MGHRDDLFIARSDDHGETWSEPAQLTKGEEWHQGIGNFLFANGCVYFAWDRYVDANRRNFLTIAPVLMRGRLDNDLLKPGSWTYATNLSFEQAYSEQKGTGLPFALRAGSEQENPSLALGWLETSVVQFPDPSHVWHDPAGKTFYLWLRARTGTTNIAAVARVVEQGPMPGTGSMHTLVAEAPSGVSVVHLPFPGGQMKFDVLYDEVSRLYWLVSTQAVDSAIPSEKWPKDRYRNERRRLQLHFSRNMIDWCFAGLVAIGPGEHASRHYASMMVDGDDLYIFSRSGDLRARNAHDVNLITFHTIRNFRGLVY